jgi:sporulation protein YlmC with PRC-barrel domain
MINVEIPIGAEVHSMEGPYGRALSIILNPIEEKVTHLVVEENEFPQTQRLIPIELVQVTSPQQINLMCTADQLKKMETFLEEEFIHADPKVGSVFIWPYSVPATDLITLEYENMPVGEIAIRRGTHVCASDGWIGRVDELMIDRKDRKITHLVLREGHLWGQKDISIPVSQIDHMDQDTIYLKLSKKEVEALSEIPIHRFGS